MTKAELIRALIGVPADYEIMLGETILPDQYEGTEINNRVLASDRVRFEDEKRRVVIVAK